MKVETNAVDMFLLGVSTHGSTLPDTEMFALRCSSV